ncbi:MAG: type III-A CRISPR-associated RAMP protein Csm4 [candidate division WOR-3 bacterium]
MKALTLHLRCPTGFKNSLPRSDTLFGAVCWGLWLLYGQERLQQFLESYTNDNPALLTSSAFPCLTVGGQTTHLFPKPKSCPAELQFDENHHDLAKSFRKVRYLDGDLFQYFIQEGLTDQNLWEWLLQDKVQLSEDRQILSKGGVKTLSARSEVVPGNAIDRLSGAALEGMLYHSTEWFFGPDTDAFILVRLAEEWEKKILAVFRYYGDKGLGGDSSVGKGGYRLEVSNGLPFCEPVGGRRWVTLSLYYPRPDEWTFFRQNLDQAWYSVTKRKGKVESGFSPTSNIWKKSVLMLEEGSSFPEMDGCRNYGTLVEVGTRPDGGSILQHGLAFAVRMR